LQGFNITTNPDDLDIELIYSFISNTYWANNIPLETFKKSLVNSLVFGVYDDKNQQAGFARVITDKATFAYLSDVFILEAYRGLGLSKFLLRTICEHTDLQGLRRFMLVTSSAHSLYAKFGFKPVSKPEMLMQIWQPTIYETT